MAVLLEIQVFADVAVSICEQLPTFRVGRDSSVGIALRAGRSGDRIPVGASFRTRPDRPWGPSSVLYNAYRAFPGGKAVVAWR
jgi:hypothetical protein